MPEDTPARLLTNEELVNDILGKVINYLRERTLKEKTGDGSEEYFQGLKPEEQQRLGLEFETFTNDWNVQVQKVLDALRRPSAWNVSQRGNFVAAFRGRGEAKGQLAGSVPGLDWKKEDLASSAVPDQLRAEINRIQNSKALLETAKLPFCRDVDLWHIYFDGTETGSPDQDAFALFVHSAPADHALRLLEWKNDKIYQLNDDGNFRLSAGLDFYIRCFMHLVRSRQGRFILLETDEDVELRVPWEPEAAPGSEKRSEAMRKISRYVAPLERKAIDAEGKNKFRGTILFGNALFRSDIAVDPNGLISLENEILEIDGRLPVEIKSAGHEAQNHIAQ